MRKAYKLHKFAGLSAGLVLFILGLTGFLLDHKQWSWLYDVKINNFFLPQSTIEKENRLYQTHLDFQDKTYIATMRALYVKENNETKISLDQVTYDMRIEKETNRLFSATNSGIFVKNGDNWDIFALKDRNVNAIALANGKIFASVDKSELYTINTATKEIKALGIADIKREQKEITLSRFVRDLHYGRGLFDDGWSLLINDIAALYMVLLAVTGYWMFVIIRRQKRGIKSKKSYLKTMIKIHGNPVTIALIIPFFILLVTGIFLDHSGFFRSFMSSTKIPVAIQPPVYETLHEDIWSVDYDGKTFKIGNRIGLFESSDGSTWNEVNHGFAYKLIRFKENLYISGMGAPNKIEQNGSYKVLPKTPHMFKSLSDERTFNKSFPLHHTNTSLYTVMLTLHDGTFFASWWIWINDYASIMLFILFVTGSLRYFKKKRYL
jgi:hypothetical protein